MARTPATEFFGAELRHARETVGLSRDEFGKLVSYAPSTIGAFETGERFPSRSLAAGADEHLKTDGVFSRMVEKLLTGYVHPEWFRPWSDIEQQATAIRTYESNMVPGLLQVEGYARALLVDDDRVAARMARQDVLSKEKRPQLIAIIDETVLYRQVGTRATMYEQLLHLLDATASVQVAQHGGDCYLGLDGPFVHALVDGREYVHVDTPARGFVLDSAEIVSEIRHRWDALRGEALPQRQSRELITKVAESWKIPS